MKKATNLLFRGFKSYVDDQLFAKLGEAAQIAIDKLCLGATGSRAAELEICRFVSLESTIVPIVPYLSTKIGLVVSDLPSEEV